MLHTAIIMDGNGRWAAARSLPRLAGHRAGADAVRRVALAAPDLGITDLTLYAFSSDNWRRPKAETSGLMRLFRQFLRQRTAECRRNGVRLTIIGRRDRLASDLRAAIAASEAATAAQSKLHLRIAIDYSSRDAILAAAHERPAKREALAQLTGVPEVDLLIRTGGEQRLSDFLLWESAYAELYFTPRLWPDFSAGDLAEAVRAFQARHRRFGALPPGYCGVPA